MAFQQQICFLKVSDLDSAQAFFAEVLDLELVRDQGRCRIFKTGPQSFVGICLSVAPIAPQGSLLTLVTDDVDTVHARCLRHGIPVEHSPRHNHEFGIYHFFCMGPDGHRVEVQRFIEPLS